MTLGCKDNGIWKIEHLFFLSSKRDWNVQCDDFSNTPGIVTLLPSSLTGLSLVWAGWTESFIQHLYIVACFTSHFLHYTCLQGNAFIKNKVHFLSYLIISWLLGCFAFLFLATILAYKCFFLSHHFFFVHHELLTFRKYFCLH